MQFWEKSASDTQYIDVLLFDEFSNHCLANTVEPLRAANMLSGRDHYRWRFLAMDLAPVTSSSGLQVTPDATLAGTGGDMLVVMPSYGYRAHSGWRAQAALRSAARRYDTMAAMDTGSWLLAEAGLLDHSAATIHWQELTSFAERFPHIDTRRERFVIDGNRITCSGAMAAFDLVIHLIEERHGSALALEVSQLFMTRNSARSHTQGGRAKSPSVNQALAVMQEHLESPLSIPDIARRIGRTQKTLESRMRAELGAGPAKVYRRLRLNLARKLVVETTLPISEIALRAGYENASAMTRAYRQAFGAAPTDMRGRD
ncbi:MAG: GlxA family transcriptional regulator [Pseudomonadota bacterium]